MIPQAHTAAKRPDPILFQGRVLLLVDDALAVERQLAGHDLPFEPECPDAFARLRDDISTDEITPAMICYYHDDTLGEFAYLGVRAGGGFPFERGSVRRGRFVASVAGDRRGKGSSREQSPFAERAAGVELVLAKSVERIYRENCQNLGLLVSTDLGLVGRIRSGQAIPLSEFTAGQGPITKGIIEYGGLFAYNVARLRGDVRVPAPTTPPRPMTLVEKILARHWVCGGGEAEPAPVPAVRPGDEGFVAVDLRFSHEYVTPMAAMQFEKLVGVDAPVTDPGTVLFFRDHLTFLDQAMRPEHVAMGLLDAAVALAETQRSFARAKGIRLFGEAAEGVARGKHALESAGSEAICHAKVLEDFALPGHVIVGSDSHTPHAGAIGCVAFGIGTTAVMNAWVTRDVRVTVPRALRVDLRGTMPANVTAKDVMLELLRHPLVRSGGAIGMAVEYAGDAVAAMSIDERATLTNMAAEVGAFTAVVPPDGATVRYLVARRGMSERHAWALCDGLVSDPEAEYHAVISIDVSSLRPMVALPGDPGNGVTVDELPDDVAVDIAYAGSCTAGKCADMDMYATVFAEARSRGARVAGSVRCYVQCGSREVYGYCVDRGYDQLFEAVGASLIAPSCGACIGAGPGVSRSTTEVTISAINRNFPGRSGPGQLYLASPYTVAASAIAGRIVAWNADAGRA
jgi:3-isopropylmalate/(R)-2-methylmalate dehydratase large subunit